MSSTTSLATIQSLCKMFACVGLPEQVITDNGRNFVSEEFIRVPSKEWNQTHYLCPYHLSNNRLAERATELPLNQQQELLLLNYCWEEATISSESIKARSIIILKLKQSKQNNA